MIRIKNRVISAILVMAFLATMILQPVSGNNVKAASSSVLYIKNVKVFSADDGTKKDAEAWCAAQDENKDSDEDNDWHVIDGDLNDGAEGTLKSAVGVFLVYQTTTDAKEAVTDLAVMNEKGNYSASEYEAILEEQKSLYKDIVNDMKDMLEEYRTNYKNNRQSAINVHDFLNTYIEDDSGKRLGDLLIDISDDDLVNLLLQANGQVLLTIQDQLSYACDSKESTWLDRMEKLGSYDAMVKSIANKKHITKSAAKDVLKKNYNDRAVKILQGWDDVNMHFEVIQKYESDNGKEDMSDEEWNEFIKERQEQMGKDAESDDVSAEDAYEDSEFYKYVHEIQFLNTLNTYVFDGKTLSTYFKQSYDDVCDENITKLYPLAASLTEGQIGALNESVSLYTLIESAIYATTYNGYEKGKLVEYEEYVDDKLKEKIDENLETSKEMIKDLNNNDPISVYEGVDREIFEGGVAVTSQAKTYSNSVPENWTDSFINSNGFAITSLGMLAGAVCFSVASVSCAITINTTLSDYLSDGLNSITDKAMKKVYDQMRDDFDALIGDMCNDPYKIEYYAQNYTYNEFKNLKPELAKGANFKELKVELADNQKLGAYDEAMKELKQQSSANIKKETDIYTSTKAKSELLKKLKIGFAVVAIILAIADIVMTSITLYNYYNRDHVEIPKFMVDVLFDEDGSSSFTNYRNVLSTDGSAGDLNGGGGKQWLALYFTKDRAAGNPILAPDEDNDAFLYQTGSEGAEADYSPLHMFGDLNVSQNLTYADGEKGYSFNDKNDGTYLFFKRDANPYYGDNEDNSKNTATTISIGSIALGGGVGLILGFILAFIVFRITKKKEEKAV